MSKTTISDSRICVAPCEKLLDLISTYKDEISEIPENFSEVLKKNGCKLPTNVEILKSASAKQHTINLKLLASLTQHANQSDDKEERDESDDIHDHENQNEKEKLVKSNGYMYLPDLVWLNAFLAYLRKQHGIKIYLHDLLVSCEICLPENDIIERNPELEARCQKLRQEQQNREYMKMTKNVDAALKNYPEDTIAYQMKTLNKQIIAVFQFVLSVVAGFAFGFLGLEWIIGGLDFGLRLLLGIMIALIIALAEIYFLAKKLNEYDDVTETANTYHRINKSPAKNKKPHSD